VVPAVLVYAWRVPAVVWKFSEFVNECETLCPRLGVHILEEIRNKMKGGDNQIRFGLLIWAASVAISGFFGWQLYVASTILGGGHEASKTVVANMFYTSFVMGWVALGMAALFWREIH
jgi:hypothetical protein